MKIVINFLKIHKVLFSVGLLIAFLSFLGFWGYQRYFPANIKKDLPIEEVILNFDPDGPYVLMSPRGDGNAMQLKIRRIASYDAISYSLAYTDGEGISRGVGDENTWIGVKKDTGDYEQEILFGTCSKNVCKYDEGVENGTLLLSIKKANKVYKMSSQWHLQKPEQSLGVLTSGDGHFSYKINQISQKEDILRFSIINDISAAPKLPKGKKVIGKVYAINLPPAKTLGPGTIAIELADNPPSDSRIYAYIDAQNNWKELDSTIKIASISASSDGGLVFAVLSPN